MSKKNKKSDKQMQKFVTFVASLRLIQETMSSRNASLLPRVCFLAYSFQSRLAPSVNATLAYVNLYFRNRHDELAPPLSDIGHLLCNLILQVPGENKQIIRFCLLDMIGMIDRDMGSWQKMSLLVRAAVNSIIDEI